MKRLSRLGLILASLYGLFVVFCVVRTELCLSRGWFILCDWLFSSGTAVESKRWSDTGQLFRSLGRN